MRRETRAGSGRQSPGGLATLGIPPLAVHGTELRNTMPSSTTIARENHLGWPNTFRLSNGLIEARVVTDIGPRLVDVRPTGAGNLLYVRTAEAGGTGEPAWMFRGGWRLWVAPETRARTYALDNAACQAEIVGSTLQVTAPPQPDAGIRKRVDVTLNPGERRLRITSRITNISPRPVTCAAWSLPVMQPGGRAFVPLDVGPLAAFDSIRRVMLWSYTRFADPRYRFHDRLVEIDHALVQPASADQPGRSEDESKIGVDSAAGWEAYLLGGTLFLKRFPHDASGPYPDGGATLEVYSSREFLELEHLGPLTTLAPGQEIRFPEDWWLFTGVTLGRTESEILDGLRPYLDQAPYP